MSTFCSKVRLIDIVVINEAKVLVVEIDSASVWFKSSKLSLNVDKTKQPAIVPFFVSKMISYIKREKCNKILGRIY